MNKIIIALVAVFFVVLFLRWDSLGIEHVISLSAVTISFLLGYLHSILNKDKTRLESSPQLVKNFADVEEINLTYIRLAILLTALALVLFFI
jgi:hypothetical protein